MTIFVEIINIPVVDMYKTNVSQTTENIEIFSRSPFSQAVCIKRALLAINTFFWGNYVIFSH